MTAVFEVAVFKANLHRSLDRLRTECSCAGKNIQTGSQQVLICCYEEHLLKIHINWAQLTTSSVTMITSYNEQISLHQNQC